MLRPEGRWRLSRWGAVRAAEAPDDEQLAYSSPHRPLPGLRPRNWLQRQCVNRW